MAGDVALVMWCPGLTVLARAGTGPLDDDIALPGGLYQASKGRALAENTRPSRSRNGHIRRTLDEAELGDWVDRLCQVDGPRQLSRYREKAEQVGEAVGAPAEGVRRLSQMIGSALGTKQVRIASKALTARQAALPYDQDRIYRLIAGLRGSAAQNRPVQDLRDPRYRYLPFFEAYTAQIRFADLEETTDILLATNAFNEPDSEQRLLLPSSLGL
jgi:hypothetical protein